MIVSTVRSTPGKRQRHDSPDAPSAPCATRAPCAPRAPSAPIAQGLDNIAQAMDNLRQAMVDFRQANDDFNQTLSSIPGSFSVALSSLSSLFIPSSWIQSSSIIV